MAKQIKYKSNNNIVFSCKYHIVWCPKYRRKVLIDEVEIRLKEQSNHRVATGKSVGIDFGMKTCSKCGHVLKELDLKIREWTCPSCEAQHQRDVNAALNIKRVGTSTLAGEVVRATSVA